MSTHTLEVAETMCDRIAIVHGGKIVAHGNHGRAAGADLLGGSRAGGTLPQAHRRHAGAPARHHPRSPDPVTAQCSARASGLCSRPSGGALWRGYARRRVGRGPEPFCWDWSPWCSGSACSGLPTGCFATSAAWRTSAISSPPRCSESSCWRFCPSCCSRTSLPPSRPSFWPRISICWWQRRSASHGSTPPSWWRRWSTPPGWWRCWRCRSLRPTGSCSAAGFSFRSWRSRPSFPTWSFRRWWVRPSP